MKRRISLLLVLSLTLVALMAMTAFAAKSPIIKKRVIDPRVNKVVQYTLPYPDEHVMTTPGDNNLASKESLGRSSAAASPGVWVGDTWYDYQHNGTMGRMIDIGEHDGSAMVHMTWMRLPQRDMGGVRKYYYNYYDASLSSGSVTSQLPVSGEWSGYCGVQALDDNRALVGGHERPGTTFAPQFYWDDGPGGEYFGDFITRVPDSVESYGASQLGQEVIWPKWRYQELTSDTVLHVIAQASGVGAGDPQAIYYFRKVGTLVDIYATEWDYPPLVIDTIYDLSQDIACSKTTGKVALVWTANLAGDDGAANAGLNSEGYPDTDVCDINSGTASFVQLDNDIHIMISDNQGVDWSPRHNITCNVDGEAGWRPYTDLSALITTDENLHVLWSGRVWPANANSGGSIGFDCRLFHWSEDIPKIRTVHNAEWDQENCNGGAWQMNVAKMSISECAGRLYAMFVMFNDIPNGVVDDCAARGNDGSDVSGSANGELWLSVSGDNGLTWDQARNLTNSYTPDCDSATGTLRCESDHWPAMVRHGRENLLPAVEDWGGAVEIDPGTTLYPHDNNYWLDMQWISDPVAGGVVQDEGGWFLADVLWARVACVPVIPNPLLNYSPNVIEYPAWGKFGQEVDTPIVLENSGNVGLTYTPVIEEDNGPTGWLGIHDMDGAIVSGEGNIEIGGLLLNQGNIVTSARLTFEPTVYLRGRIIFNSNAPTTPDTLEISFSVTDTMRVPVIDTVFSTSFALGLSSNGNYGLQGVGEVNLDYFNYGDCDTEDFIPGSSDVYLYDGSTLITRIIDIPEDDDGNTLDTVGHWAIFGDGFESDNGMRTITNHSPVSDVEFHTGATGNNDTSIIVQKSFYMAPSGADEFVLMCTRIYSPNSDSISGISIAEGIDWDIPSDSGENVGGWDPVRNMIYQVGYEWNDPLDTLECQKNDLRYGGLAFLEKIVKTGAEVAPDTFIVWTALASELDGGLAGLQANIDDARAYYTSTFGGTVIDNSTDFVGAWALTNDSLVYPANGFVASDIWENSHTLFADSNHHVWQDEQTDLHVVMVFGNDVGLRGESDDPDEDGIGTWHDNCPVHYNPLQEDENEDGIGDACEGCCIGIRGNANHDAGESVNISDVTFLVDYLFGIPTGDPPFCPEEGNANGDVSESTNISDVTYLVDYLFGIPTGAAPPDCFNND